MRKLLILFIILIIIGCNNVENDIASGCSYDNKELCDESCNDDSDCVRAADCFCLNKKDTGKIILPEFDEDGKVILWAPCPPWPCKCVNNKCE